MEKIEITVEEYNRLKNKADKWDNHIANMTKNLPSQSMTAKERSEAARKAVQARWAKNKKKVN